MSKPKLLFLCVHNTARSQMAEGFAQQFFGKDASVQSAGTEPGSHIHPLAVRVMKDRGIDISEQRPKGVAEVELESVDTVIILSKEDITPAFISQSVRKLHWPIPDPDEEAKGLDETDALKVFKKTMKEIRARMEQLAVDIEGT